MAEEVIDLCDEEGDIDQADCSAPKVNALSLLLGNSKGKTNSSFKKSKSSPLPAQFGIDSKKFRSFVPSFKQVILGGLNVPIIIDGFKFANSESTDTYFLTHFHSDHYDGIKAYFPFGNFVL